MLNTLHQRVSAASTTSGDFGDFSAGNSGSVDIDIEITVLTATDSIVWTLDRKGEDGNYTTIWTSRTVTASGSVLATVPVRGRVNQSAIAVLRLTRTITNTSGSASVTYSATVVGHQ